MHLEAFGFETRHIDPDCVPESLSLAAMVASDAWRFAERMHLVNTEGPTPKGLEIGTLADGGEQYRNESLRCVLRPGVEANLRGRGDVSILEMLRALSGRARIFGREPVRDSCRSK